MMTHIFFLLTRGQVSHLHKIASDELWHFYGGDPLTVVEADPKTGSVLETTIGREVAMPFHAVRAGKWFGARAEGEWSLGEGAAALSRGGEDDGSQEREGAFAGAEGVLGRRGEGGGTGSALATAPVVASAGVVRCTGIAVTENRKHDLTRLCVLLRCCGGVHLCLALRSRVHGGAWIRLCGLCARGPGHSRTRAGGGAGGPPGRGSPRAQVAVATGRRVKRNRKCSRLCFRRALLWPDWQGRPGACGVA